MLSAISSLYRSSSTTLERKQNLSFLTQTVGSVRYALTIPGRIRDLVTAPLAKTTAAAGIALSCGLFEKHCTTQAYAITDKLLEQAEKTNTQLGLLSPKVVETAKRTRDAIPTIGRLISATGGCLVLGGWVLNKIAGTATSLAHSLYRSGQNLEASNSRPGRAAGTTARAGSYLISALSCIPSFLGRIEQVGSRVFSAGQQCAEFSVRNQTAQALLPVIQKMNRILIEKSLQFGYNIAAGTAVCSAVGAFQAESWVVAASYAGKASLALKGGLLGWTYGPLLKNGVQAGLACSLRKRQVEQLKQAIASDPELQIALGFAENCWKTDLLATLLIEKSSFLLGFLFNNPEEWIQVICSHSEILATARRYTFSRSD